MIYVYLTAVFIYPIALLLALLFLIIRTVFMFVWREHK